MESYEVSNRLEALRKEKKLSQRELAKLLGISHISIAEYETGNRSLPVKALKAYHNFFNVSYEYLLGESGAKDNANVHVNKDLGLSDISIEVLKFLKHSKNHVGLLKLINHLLGQILNIEVKKDEFGKKELLFKEKSEIPIITAIYDYLRVDHLLKTDNGLLEMIERMEKASGEKIDKPSFIKNYYIIIILDGLKELKERWDQL